MSTPYPIYLDNAASTKVSEAVLAQLTEVMRTAWGNPNAQHPQGAAARGYLEAARDQLLRALGDRGAGDVIWTSGCTEADALAVLGAARHRPGQVVVSTLEHPAVLEAARGLADRALVEVAPDATGRLDPEAVAAAAPGAAVVAVVMVQNELGVVQPIAEIARAVRARAPDCHLHVDAAQALGKVALDVETLGVDSIALAGHKLHAPKGVGALWLHRRARLAPLWIGGGQQRGLRGGTQDAAGAAALGLAAAHAVAEREAARARWLEFGDTIRTRLAAVGVAFRQLVPDHRRAPHILALAVPGVPAAALRTVLASRGVYVSTGSACADRDHKPSAALVALGVPTDTGMVRLSFGLDTTAHEVEVAAGVLAAVIAELGPRAP